eukprot:Skav226355  [mRNA]  locus=scaffold2980:339602:340336:- [translate_table: standard]
MAPLGRPSKRVHHIAGKRSHPMGAMGAMSRIFGSMSRLQDPQESQDHQVPGRFVGSKTSQLTSQGWKGGWQERSKGYQESKVEPKLENLVDLHLHLPNSSFLGYYGHLQDQLRGVALAHRPLISPGRLLDKPKSPQPPPLLWKPFNAGAPSGPSGPSAHLPFQAEHSELREAEFHQSQQEQEMQEVLAIELAPQCSWMRPGDIFNQPPHGPRFSGCARFPEDAPLHFRAPDPIPCDNWQRPRRY